MKLFRSTRARFVAGVAALLVAGSFGMAVAATNQSSDAMSMGRGVNEFGLTKANFQGHSLGFRYTKGFFCDTSVSAQSSSGCEVGAKFNHAPAKDFDPLYVVVPLGFKVKQMKMECPAKLVCVDHPGTLDMTRLEPALKPLYPQLTDAQLTEALKNFQTPGHNHFITTTNKGRAEWWDVRVVGVTDRAEYNKILSHQSAKYLLQQVKAGKTTPVLRSNLFLFFSVR
jgi:hypothetical protein